MSAEAPPPYHPHLSDAAASPPALSCFPGSSYQTFPQTFHTHYHGDPGLTAPGYQDGPVGPPKHTVYVVEQHHHDDGGGGDSCLAVLCCCFLWNLLTAHH
ncbi:cysteine-rich and transmembrane domain-containing protein 1-like [Amphiprion ocellaris]|uniref:cysteine-rich and transmembrane domain-containing protein 1-like n=1 Tax=Amphiprion ocellaris TaxID=80972 RepID=UPI001649C954|nr:cysteine-rich and transmembrane domain-containing protein 1-like [Amphiprion ocellaris]